MSGPHAALASLTELSERIGYQPPAPAQIEDGLIGLLLRHGWKELPIADVCRSCEVLPADIRCHFCSFLICAPCVVGEAVCLECGKPWVGGLSDDEMESLERAISIAEVALAEAARILG